MDLVIHVEAKDDFCTGCSWLDMVVSMCDLFGEQLEMNDEWCIRCEDCFNSEVKQ